MNVLRTLFPRLFGPPDAPPAVRELHRALDELAPSTEALRGKLDREPPDYLAPLRRARRNAGRSPGQEGAR